MFRYAMLFSVMLMTGSLQAGDCSIHLEEAEGFMFPAIIEIDLGLKSQKQVTFNAGKTAFDIPPGQHTLECRNWRFGFPQDAIFQIEEGNKIVWKSQPTVDPRSVSLRAGQVLRVLVGRPYESYNSRFFRVNGIACGFVFARPYWFQDATIKWSAPEDYPNSLFFLVDEEKWGPERVFGDLAAFVKKQVTDAQAPQGDYRSICHVSFICALDRNGTVPEELKQASAEALTGALLTAYKEWLNEKCYRMFPIGDVQQLKNAGFLPAETPDGRLHVPVARGVELAKPALQRWKQQNGKKS